MIWEKSRKTVLTICYTYNTIQRKVLIHSHETYSFIKYGFSSFFFYILRSYENLTCWNTAFRNSKMQISARLLNSSHLWRFKTWKHISRKINHDKNKDGSIKDALWLLEKIATKQEQQTLRWLTFKCKTGKKHMSLVYPLLTQSMLYLIFLMYVAIIQCLNTVVKILTNNLQFIVSTYPLSWRKVKVIQAGMTW